MSRIGKLAVPVPKGVTATVDGQKVTAKGPKGQLEFTVPDRVIVKQLEDGSIKVDPVNEEREARSMWGLSRTMILNLMTTIVPLSMLTTTAPQLQDLHLSGRILMKTIKFCVVVRWLPVVA